MSSLKCPCFTPSESGHPSHIYHWGNNYGPPLDWWLLPHWQAVSQTAGLPELKPLSDKWAANINHHGIGDVKCTGKTIIKGILLPSCFHSGAVSGWAHACAHTCAHREQRSPVSSQRTASEGMHFNETLGKVNSSTAASRGAHKEISEVWVGCVGEV